LYPGGFTTIKEKRADIFLTLSLRIAMPVMQGCDLLSPTSCSINTVVYMDVLTDLLVFSQCSTHCEILGLVFKAFQGVSHPSNIAHQIYAYI